MNDEIVFYTIGHSNSPSHKIVDLLKQNKIEFVVDVRSFPYSQYNPQFNRENFEISLREAGIEYKFAGEYLGGRPKDLSCYKNQEIPDGKADYLHLVDYPKVMTKSWFVKGIDRLIEINQSGRTAIMCSEGDPSTCHRHHLIAKYLMRNDFTVLHIQTDGTLLNAIQIPDLKNEPPSEQLRMF